MAELLTCVRVLSSLGHVQLLAILWTIACRAPLSMEFFRQEDWSGLPWPPPGDLPDPGIEPACPAPPALQADSLLLSHQGSTEFLMDNPERTGSCSRCR